MNDVHAAARVADNITRQRVIFEESDPNYDSRQSVLNRNRYAQQLIDTTCLGGLDRIIEALDGPEHTGLQHRKQFLRSRAIHFSNLYEGLMELLGGEGSLEERCENWERLQKSS